MASDTKIEWCDATFNPWRGCTKVSPGCQFCYADTLSARNPGTLGVWGPNGTRVVAAESYWKQPLKWDREAQAAGERRRVFCASLADVFEAWIGRMSVSDGRVLMRPYLDRENVPANWVAEPDDTTDNQGWKYVTMNDVRRRLFDLIDATPNLDWLLLTKRPENIARMMPPYFEELPLFDASEAARQPNPFAIDTALIQKRVTVPSVRHNVWLGTSVENQATADERIPHLLATPAAVRFLSVEPLLGPVDLRRWLIQSWCQYCGQHYEDIDDKKDCPRCGPGTGMIARHPRSPIHWVIVGGESGHGARPMQVEWARDIVRQCQAAGVACFMKQLGANPLMPMTASETLKWPKAQQFTDATGDRRMSIPLLSDKKGGDWSEWPDDLRVREFPTPGV